jgi:hypothetical protein
MTLREQILNDKAIALKSGDQVTKNLLNFVAGELTRYNLITDEQVLKQLKTTTESCKTCGKLDEVAILEKYIPEMMSEKVIAYEVAKFIIKMTDEVKISDLGKFMGYMKQNFNGLYDGKLASDLFRKYFNQ